MRTVQVSLADRSYEILVERGLLPSLASRCRDLKLGRRCAIITDSNVGPAYSSAIEQSLQEHGFDPIIVQIPAGEKAKALKYFAECCDKLAEHRLERKSFIVALGGGVVGDLAGFVAASYLRGVPFVQVPTTLLAQVDSSVGGKTGVNLKAGKNLVGAFYQPRLVLCDLATFDTLPEREFRAGLAEVIKYGIIHDAELFSRLEHDLDSILKRDAAVLADVVARCCEIKADVVGQDETESGLRAILNFGHTIGHGLEAISRYGKYLHGEAISIGQVAAARLSELQLGFASGDVARVRELFRRAGLPVSVRLSESQQLALFEAMQRDKKVSAGEIKFVLARRIGSAEFGHSVPKEQIEQVLQELRVQR